ncbi:hypothetical protein CMI37_23790 [Candidatus Pacearchaeota archaeon]|nr:hypothetical protein [Candidatus Pacearchaeota archaeon]|tara:strand:- start:3293 stop:3628 length:336 start_codon:yes stop_codon:yes gene_type:complete
MKYKIETKNERVHVTVTLDSVGTHARPHPRERLNKKDVMKILILEKINHGACIIDPGYLSNFEEASPTLTKTWVFKCTDKVEPSSQPKPKKRSTPRKRPTGTSRNKKKKNT